MTKKLLLAAILLGGLAITARADIFIINDNLDSFSGGAPGFAFGDGVNQTRNYVSGAGVGGSVGMVETGDFVGANGFGGLALQFQNVTATGNTSANLSDYTLSFDASVNEANGGFRVVFESWPGQNFGGTQTGQGRIPSNIQIASPNTFQHFALNLGTFVLDPFGSPTLPNPSGQTLQIAWQMDQGAPYANGTTGHQIVIDNVQLTMVPEPSSLALFAMGAAGGFAFLRRRKA